MSSEAHTPQEALDANGTGQSPEHRNQGYPGNEDAHAAIRQFIDERVDDLVITSSRSIARYVDIDVRAQEIGKTIGAYRSGDAPSGWFPNVEISTWRDTHPIKWQFERVAGDADVRRSRQIRYPDLIREITAETGAGDDGFQPVPDEGRSHKARITVTWMRDVLDAVCAATDSTPTPDAEDIDRGVWIDELTQAGTTAVLERVLDIDIEGDRTHWSKPTLQAIHDIVIAGRDPSEVSG